ncbi:MAG TPA: hypothetical protein VHW09_32430 [Bryobacteraceae bacterium]|jgi:hypothetical protein|nr:hypothetical protein [Bryobacteraceae bacterium]
MRLRAASLLLSVGVATAHAALPYFSVLSDNAGAWPAILSSIGLEPQPASKAHIFVARAGAPASAEWNARVEQGAILILEGESSLAEMFGFKPGKDRVRVTSLADVHSPKLSIVWEKSEELPVFSLPEGAQVFARERWNGVPLSAGIRRGMGAVLWIASTPGEHGYERFPYILAALCDLGMETPFRSARLWAFFDSAYRSRVDLDYFAARWRRSGISTLQVAAWHFYDPDPENDAYLRKLIVACHREGIQVYAWVELPHVSDKFWAAHPEWREKTALLQDAQLDWRKLMNLTNRDCFHAVSAGVKRLVTGFDWDGVNLAELYFESLEGIGNPSRFTPMDDDVRSLFRQQSGFDPIELFSTRKDAMSRQEFLDFRAGLARKMQEEWLGELESVRREKPQLDLVLTHVDDRFDTGMRDAIGADAARVLPLLGSHNFTFLIEDPATVWNQGPQRYQAIAERYRALTPHAEKLAIDLNIVDRYQNVYPTKQQTGTELFQLVHQAAASFQRVALYFENSLLPPDLSLLPSAAAKVTRIERVGGKTVVESANGVGLPWKGPAIVDDLPWPVADGDTIWLPPGAHSVEAAKEGVGLHVLRLNADLREARSTGPNGVEFFYESSARAIAVFDRRPCKLTVDGTEQAIEFAGPDTILLPRGQHVVTITSE